MFKEIGAFVGRDKMIPEYQRRAQSLRNAAVNESLAEGAFAIKRTEGVSLIEETTGTSVITLPNKRKLEFAFGENNIAFARIEEGKYYELDTKFPKSLLKLAKKYDKLSVNRARRFLWATTGLEADIDLTGLIEQMSNLNARLASMYLKLEKLDVLIMELESQDKQNTN